MSPRLAAAFIFGLAAFLRFYHLDGYGLWSDEFVTLMIVSIKSYSELVKTCFEVPQPMPPLYFALNKWVFDWFPAGEIGLRFLSAACGTLTSVALFSLGRMLLNTEVGLWAAVLFAVNSTQIVYGQNARPYALCMMLSSFSMVCFLKWLQNRSWSWRLGYLISTSLLLYTHYIFFEVLLIQGVYFAWSNRRRLVPLRLRGVWAEWGMLQLTLGLLLLPLNSQLRRLVSSRDSLNWANRIPLTAGDVLVFWDAKPLWRAVIVGFLLALCQPILVRILKKQPSPIPPKGLLKKSFVLLGLWYALPLTFAATLLLIWRINLFVERYLTLSSLSIFLILPCVAFALGGSWVGRGGIIAYLVSYTWLVPLNLFHVKGQFSAGVPGGNEWREALSELDLPRYQASLFFQSPFIESNQLNFSRDPSLRDYLAAPLLSFYSKTPRRQFVLLPVHWWINSPGHRRFKTEIRTQLQSKTEFVLLSTEEFWQNFEPWLDKEFEKSIGWIVLDRFRSSGALLVLHLGRPSAF